MTRQEAANHAAALGWPQIFCNNRYQWFASIHPPELLHNIMWCNHGLVFGINTTIDYTGDWKDSLTEGGVK